MKPDEIKRYMPCNFGAMGEIPGGSYLLAADHDRVVAELRADLALLSDKAGAAVIAYRAALSSLTDSFKYPNEVCLIAWAALGAK